jgi:hypothetical protein
LSVIFSRDQAALVRQGKLTAALVPTSQQIKADRTRPLRRRFMRHDADGAEQGETVQTVEDISPEGDRKPVVLTITSVTETHLDNLTLSDAKACGFQTLTGLKDAWRSKHPRTLVVKVVRFQLGDIRDRDRFLNWTGRAGGDYTGNRHRAADDVAALPAEQLAPLTKAANERDRARAKSGSQRRRDEMAALADRWREELRESPNREVARSLRAIEHQLAALDRKLKAA